MRAAASTLVVWFVWATLFAGALVLVARYGSNVPSWDEWDMVPTLTGHQPVTLEWLWSQHNEHRVPLHRLLMLAMNGFGGPDFRIAQYGNAVVLAAAAAALILAARRARGGETRVSDAFFPLVLLHWRHAPNVIWGWQLQFMASAALACALAAALAASARRPARVNLLVAGACLLLLPLCGANGVALVPAPALWLGAVAFVALRAKETGRALATGGAALASLVLVLAYFADFERVPNQAMGSSWRAASEEAVRFLAAGLGPTLGDSWPLTGVATLLVLLATAALLLWSVLRRPEARTRALGLLSFLAAMGCLALGMGLGGRYGFEPRYVTLAAPVWCGAYLAWASSAPSMRLGTVAASLLALASLAAFVPNLASGIEYARDVHAHLTAFERDVTDGLPPYRLIARHGRYLHPHHELLSDYLPMLRDAGVGVFPNLREDPEFIEVPIPLVPVWADQCRIDGDTIHSSGDVPRFDLELPAHTGDIAGFRLRCEHSSPRPGLPCIALYWHDGSAGARFLEPYYMFSPTGDRLTWERHSWSRRAAREIELTCWVDGPAVALRMHPDYKPCDLRVREFVMLVPKP